MRNAYRNVITKAEKKRHGRRWDHIIEISHDEIRYGLDSISEQGIAADS
jgi:hypothetical protein